MAANPVGLFPTQAMEQYSRGYVTAIAAAASCSVVSVTVDDDGIDVILQRRGRHEHVESPQLGVQLKACSTLSVDGNSVRYDLKVANYNRLIRTNLLVPHILVLLHVPADHDSWIAYQDNHILLHHRAYWASLAGRPATDNAHTVSVTLPKAQVLDTQALVGLMNRVSRNGLQ